MKTKVKKYTVQAHFDWGWSQSGNLGADGKYGKESAERRAKLQQAKSGTNLKYRIKEIK